MFLILSFSKASASQLSIITNINSLQEFDFITNFCFSFSLLFLEYIVQKSISQVILPVFYTKLIVNFQIVV